jgi:hypothetical protein
VGGGYIFVHRLLLEHFAGRFSQGKVSQRALNADQLAE